LPRATRFDIDRFRKENAWMHVPADPELCGCRHYRCCKENGHLSGQCRRPPTVKTWTFREEYRCAVCIEYMFGGSRS